MKMQLWRVCLANADAAAVDGLQNAPLDWRLTGGESEHYYRIQGCSEAIEDMASMHHKWLGSAPRQHPWRPQPQSPNVPTLPSSARETRYSEKLSASRKEQSPWPFYILAVEKKCARCDILQGHRTFTGHSVGSECAGVFGSQETLKEHLRTQIHTLSAGPVA
jgi:hypothetical protein